MALPWLLLNVGTDPAVATVGFRGPLPFWFAGVGGEEVIAPPATGGMGFWAAPIERRKRRALAPGTTLYARVVLFPGTGYGIRNVDDVLVDNDLLMISTSLD